VKRLPETAISALLLRAPSLPCEEVEVEAVEEPDALVFELKVAEEDLGKVIGKQGRTAKALRTILSAASAKSRRRVILEILE